LIFCSLGTGQSGATPQQVACSLALKFGQTAGPKRSTSQWAAMRTENILKLFVLDVFRQITDVDTLSDSHRYLRRHLFACSSPRTQGQATRLQVQCVLMSCTSRMTGLSNLIAGSELASAEAIGPVAAREQPGPAQLLRSHRRTYSRDFPEEQLENLPVTKRRYCWRWRAL
jgi:hypothetical protein